MTQTNNHCVCLCVCVSVCVCVCLCVCLCVCVCSVWVAPAAASPGHPGSAGLPDHPSIPAQEEEAEGQPDQPEDPERKPQGGERDRHRGPEQRQRVLLSLLALQNCEFTFSTLLLCWFFSVILRRLRSTDRLIWSCFLFLVSCLWQVTFKAQWADWRQRGTAHTQKEDSIINCWCVFSFHLHRL